MCTKQIPGEFCAPSQTTFANCHGVIAHFDGQISTTNLLLAASNGSIDWYFEGEETWWADLILFVSL
jgi:hypothetical protein